ncbi:nickel transport system ATP-binding protein [Natranaerovirga hydrolytica]|uniref:Nickel transport system ATP-binding protein n=1 Tax=Natranaerovirga hydrolytica TaxID=680378 RepID=A0A4R1MJG0_9FIRM|nr:dipeptide/oligopeptide/nickel ABC transporter ATP-binding protein [Natranaerovirga hydrolytica]TCK92627.1 nickel transport system ATP-binding protein [Natranaerovirga hydrolytica]
MELKVNNVYKNYKKTLSTGKKEKVTIVKGVSLTVKEKECIGIIGESGSGKSTLGRLIIGFEKPDKGTVLLNGEDLTQSKNRVLKKNISVVFQDYTSSVNPRFKVKNILAEPIKKFDKVNKSEIKKKSIGLLEKVGLNENFLERYPHELSGGQLQRVCIARAIATNPKIIVLDEAISSLDVSIQVQVLDLLIQLKNEMDISYIFITHDLTAITYICDQVIFFKEGNIVEQVNDMKNLKNVKEAYSKELLNAAKKMNEGEGLHDIQRIS